MPLLSLKEQKKRRTPEQLIKHMKTFQLDLKFSAGVWFFFPGGGRFHDAYIDRPSKQDWLGRVFEIAAGLKKYGLRGLEAHYPNEINEENIGQYRKFAKDTGIRVVSIVPNLFFQRDLEWGALSSPIKKVRRMAIDRTITTLRMNKELGTDFAIVWPGIDGFENPFGMDFIAARDRFTDGLAEAMDAVPGVRVAEEPKPYEPRGHILYGTTAEGILMALKCEAALKNPKNMAILKRGECLVGLNPEVGHMLMGYEDLAYAFSLVLEYGKLTHTHWNSQPLGNYDQDMNVGLISPEQTEAALYVMKMHSYRGYFGIDINPERMPVCRALINCMDALRAANERVSKLDHEKVILCTSEPQKHRGYLEALLLRARYCCAKTMSEMPKF
jgi:xylose isomerase